MIFKEGSLGKVIRFRGGREGGALMMGSAPLEEEMPENRVSLSLSCEDSVSRCLSAGHDKSSGQNLSMSAPSSQTSRL